MQQLKALPMFRGCTPKDLKKVASLGMRVSVARGRQLTRVGERGTEVFIVLSGTAECVVHNAVVAQFGTGDFFGEIAMLDGGTRTATVIAETDMELLVFNRHEFLTLVKASPVVAHRMLEAMARRVRRADAIMVG
jgi:CRP-like cAMP-binding protein